MSPPSSLYEAVVSQVSKVEVPSLEECVEEAEKMYEEAEKIMHANVEVVGSEQRLVMIIGLTFFGIAILGPAILSSLNWVVWVAFSLVLGACQLLYALYQLVRIILNLVIMSVFKSVNKILRVFSCKSNNREKAAKQRQRRLSRVDSLKEFKESEGGRSRSASRQNSDDGVDGAGAADGDGAAAGGAAAGKARGGIGGGGSGLDLAKMVERYGGVFGEVDDEVNEEQEKWRHSTSDFPQAAILRKTTSRLAEARTAKNLKDLQFLLSGLLKRNHLGIHEDALYEHTAVGTKVDIEAFQAEIDACLETLLESEELPFDEKLSFFKKERRSLGRTALCLSGGGAITMYHMGVVKAFIEAELYKNIRVISGTSGGAITAGMLATKTESELLRDVIVDNVSTDFKRDGSQAAEGVRWFPKLWDQLVNFTRKRVLVERTEFKRCCDYYYGTTTFAEAYAHTKKHVSISVSNSQLGCMYSGKRRVLLNHISSPHVTVASAVAASCSLPGIMLPNKLWAKDADGNIVPFEVDGVEFIDGSILADLPFKRMSTLFNVSNFIVSQVNFHVTPFLHKLHSPKKDTRYWKILSFLDHDIRSRAQALSQLGLLPTFFGQTISGVAKQKYHGDVTIVPSFTSAETMGIKAVFNPDVQDMRHYIAGGERATWPHLNRIKFMMRTETKLGSCITRLQKSLLERPSELRNSQWEHQLSSLHSFTNLPHAEIPSQGLKAASSLKPNENGSGSGSGSGKEGTIRSSAADRLGSEDLDDGFDSNDEEETTRARQASEGAFSSRLQWEVAKLTHEVEQLSAENNELRSQLCQIQQLAASAASIKPHPSSMRASADKT